MGWKEYYRDPVEYVDRISVTFRGNELNLLKNHVGLRKAIYIYAWVTGLVWALCGFDSGTGQIEWVLVNIPRYLMGEISLEGLLSYWGWAYGKTMHWSAFVIYGFLFVGISLALERNLGFTNTKNSMYSFAFTLFNVGLFEYFWIYSFAHFQNQPWMTTYVLPQLRILVQNGGLFTVGLLAILHLWLWSYELDDEGDVTGRLYHFQPDWKILAIVSLTVAGSLLWIYYPWHVSQFTVEIEGIGTWMNSRYFPQTLYTIDVDVTDLVNAGEWFYVQNDLIHLVNTVVKALFAACSYVWTASWRRVK